MDPAIKQGFAIGLVIAAVAGFVGWRQGWWPTPGVTEKVGALSPAGPEAAPPAHPPLAKADRGAPAEPGKGGPPAAEAKPASPAEQKLSTPGDVARLSPPPAKGEPAPKTPPVEKGAFDVVRVEPSGETVVAGRCAAGCVVELTVNGKPVDKAQADGAGAWVMTPPKLPPGDHELGLKVTGPDGARAPSEQSVTVSVPRDAKGDVAVVLNEPNAPSKILQRPGETALAAKPPAAVNAPADPGRKAGEAAKAPGEAAVSIGAVDAEKGRLFVQGAAPAGAALRVYLNNALIAQPVAGKDARWSVRVERGLTPGDYVARVDRVEKPTGKVLARAEARFVYEPDVAQATPEPARPSAEAASPRAAAPKGDREKTAFADGRTTTFAAPPAPNEAVAGTPAAAPDPDRAPAAAAEPEVGPDAAANLVVASIDTANVRRGDSLWRISRKTYGSGTRYTVIFTANDKQIRDPDLIYPGQVLVLPEDPGKAASRSSAPAR
ncbi:LysM peptidoglycan-binding domain-containing protein [Methylopila sp. M107]|uniref:LysM peptidoglycan-binding domain-containing protein n=1 Tax=Methylopila sp. M107 TaxID=1101190 RepID=UPI0003799B91|nr:LysM peptidoglycan-binding domain-containing protein [Methylopila sp. M107]